MAINVIAAALTGGDKVPWPDRLRAAIYVTKARGGWRERDVVEHTGRDGGPIEHLDVTKLSDHELQELDRLQRKLGMASAPAGANGTDPTRH